jgi:hypothetical protein
MFKSDSYYFSWTIRGSNPSKGKRFSLFSKMSRAALWAHLPSYYMGIWDSSPGAKHPEHEVDLHPVPRLGICGAILPLPLYALRA